LLVGCTGCNVVFPLEPPRDAASDALTGHDEDRDGIDDGIDPCPHLASANLGDTDGDGIGDDCDPYPNLLGDERYFYSFVDGIRDLDVAASFHQVDDAIELVEANQQLQSLYLPIPDADDVELELGYQLLAPMPDGAYHEVGVFAVGHGVNDLATQGDVCYGGYDAEPYLDVQESGTGVAMRYVMMAPTFDVPATVHMRRTPEQVRCSLVIPGGQSDGTIVPQISQPGRTGIAVGFARARLLYLWVFVHH